MPGFYRLSSLVSPQSSKYRISAGFRRSDAAGIRRLSEKFDFAFHAQEPPHFFLGLIVPPDIQLTFQHEL